MNLRGPAAQRRLSKHHDCGTGFLCHHLPLTAPDRLSLCEQKGRPKTRKDDKFQEQALITISKIIGKGGAGLEKREWMGSSFIGSILI